MVYSTRSGQADTCPPTPMNSQQRVFILFGAVQGALLLIELLTAYDTLQRQLALSVTNVVTTVAVLGFGLWLRRRGQTPSWLTLGLVSGSIWLDALGNFQHLYAGFWWWDRLTHTVGGMALSAAFIDWFLARRAAGMQASWPVATWLGVLVGQVLGSIYEISEWLGDLWFKTERVRGPYDTPHDLFQNLIGGVAVWLMVWLIHRRRSKLAPEA